MAFLNARRPPGRLCSPRCGNRLFQFRAIRLRIIADQVRYIRRVAILNAYLGVAPYTCNEISGLLRRHPFFLFRRVTLVAGHARLRQTIRD